MRSETNDKSFIGMLKSDTPIIPADIDKFEVGIRVKLIQYGAREMILALKKLDDAVGEVDRAHQIVTQGEQHGGCEDVKINIYSAKDVIDAELFGLRHSLECLDNAVNEIFKGVRRAAEQEVKDK